MGATYKNSPVFEIRFPGWMDDICSTIGDTVFDGIQDRMALIVTLARLNVAHGTGGPFAAGIFDTQTGRLIAPGVNLVMSLNCSIFHAEVTAILSAQKRLGTFDLGIPQLSPMEIVCSSEPCVMCLGAVLWSGIKRLVCGARHEDAERIGFDEGPRPENWPEALEKRGVQVLRNVLRDRAVSVLRIYRDSGGLIYNPSR